jgi:hypothetical protein
MCAVVVPRCDPVGHRTEGWGWRSAAKNVPRAITRGGSIPRPPPRGSSKYSADVLFTSDVLSYDFGLTQSVEPLAESVS